MTCPRCRQSPRWVITIPGDCGEPDTVRPCDQCCREAFDSWRNGDFQPNRRAVELGIDVGILDPGENIARLLVIRDELNI